MLGEKMNLTELKTERDLIKLAADFATLKHKGQIRKFGKMPYISHPSTVADLVTKYSGSAEMIAAAWLYDTLEDTNTSEEELREKFGDKVANLVVEISSPEISDKSQKGKYLADKMNTMSSEALTIKLADRLNNVSDLDKSSSNFQRLYPAETKFILDSLEEYGRPLNSQQQIIIAEIRKAIEPYNND